MTRRRMWTANTLLTLCTIGIVFGGTPPTPLWTRWAGCALALPAFLWWTATA